MKDFLQKGIIGVSLKSVFFYLSSKEKKKASFIFILLISSSLVEIFGIASLVPVILTASDPNKVKESWFFGSIYDYIGFESHQKFVLFICATLVIFFIIKNAFVLMVNLVQVKFTEKLAVKIVDSQYDKYQYLPYDMFSRLETSSLVNNILAVPVAFVNGVIRQLFLFFSEVFIIVIVILGMILYNPGLFLITMIVIFPAIALSYLPVRSMAQKIGARIDVLRPISYTSLANLFAGMVEIKIAGKQKRFKKILIDGESEIQSLEAKSYMFSLLPGRIIEIIAILAIVIIFIYSVVVEKNDNSFILNIGIFAAVAYRVMPSINRLITSSVAMKQHITVIYNLEKYRGINLIRIEENNDSINFNDGIEFKNISFSFQGMDSPVINNLSFKVKKGEKIGIIGSSGSGKTTLMNILLRIFEEQSGSILVDGVSLNSNNIAAWYKTIGYVKQNTFLMADTILNNITLRDSNPDLKQVDYAMDQASIQEFVESLPIGADTHIGESGAFLSGGQRQRIGIARALYKDMQILVMDEATSALDSKTEQEISEAIKKISNSNITMFIIAHRFSALQNCDRILELDKGVIVRECSYEQLMADN
ncbi:ATP-binding cassette domain-containing protein [Hymenobacter terrestris]|uniref:ABC transporter ATP-binding protein n=1 Tax=Hymenobacter terrestris TaxID=2748310 RepID=A0ABX2Q4L6_9BACT|nr:ABC transporter ATP-binding protein [Hymenobacter terrestris]NVO85913.1 ABC transporter ATP-binding protein [Hymenobacter terrestris]